ncbi:MAG: hypothetical protein N2445_04200, partial [Acidobacteria bacterium]|nr:hypothetical protein [Acidobacteriota bacterium]
ASVMNEAAGQSIRESDVSYIFRGTIESECIYSCTHEEKERCTRETTNHEIAHQFGVNSLCNWHCSNNSWCGDSGGECANPNYGYEWCIMHPYGGDAQLYWDMRKDGIYKMDCDDLAGQYSGCGLGNCSNGISVRTDEDPE